MQLHCNSFTFTYTVVLRTYYGRMGRENPGRIRGLYTYVCIESYSQYTHFSFHVEQFLYILLIFCLFFRIFQKRRSRNMARTQRKKKTEDVQELPLNANPAPETTPKTPKTTEKAVFVEPTIEDVTKEILDTHGDINEMGNTQMLRHILYELVWARLWKTPKSK